MRVKPIERHLRCPRALVGFLFFVTGAIWAQEFREIQGRVVHDSLSVSGIHVLNKTKGSATITDAKGYFSIVVSPGDELFFSAVQFTPKRLPITQSIFGTKELTIYLESFVNTLDEVIVTQHQLSGDPALDMNNDAIQKPVNFYNLGIPGYGGERKEKIVSGQSLLLSTLLLPISGGINVEAMYKHFSGYYKRLKKKRQLDVSFEITYKIIRFYGIQFLTERYNLDSELVYEFITGAQENYPINQAFLKNRHAEVLDFLAQYSENYSLK